MGIEAAVAVVAGLALLVPALRTVGACARTAGRRGAALRRVLGAAARRLGVRGTLAASVLAPTSVVATAANPAVAATATLPLTERPHVDPPRPAVVIAAETRSPAYVVRPGDSLWSIAAAHLGPRATDAQVARSWPRWYRANRDRIGADPSLLRPGTRLSAPPAGHHPALPSTTRRTGTSATHPAPSPDLAQAQVPAPSLDPDRR